MSTAIAEQVNQHEERLAKLEQIAQNQQSALRSIQATLGEIATLQKKQITLLEQLVVQGNGKRDH